MKKALKWIALSLVVLVLVAGGVAFFSLNGIVRAQVEKSATQSLKVKATLASANVSPFSGRVALGDFDIASPAGFTAPHIFTLGNVAVDVKYSELRGDPVRVTAIRLDKPKLVLEYAGGKLNVTTLMDGLKDPSKPSPEPDPNAKPLKLAIDSLIVSGAQVEFRAGIPGLEKPINLTVPDLMMTNIGNADGTQTGAEVGRVVMDVVKEIARNAAKSDQLPQEVRALLNLNVEQITADLQAKAQAEIGKVTEQVQDQVDKVKGEAGKQAEDLKGQAEKGLNDLLGGKKKKDDEKK